MLLHRPDQPHAAFDLPVVEHQRRRWKLNRGAVGALVDQQLGDRIVEPSHRLLGGHRPVALALLDGQQAGFPRRCRDAV